MARLLLCLVLLVAATISIPARAGVHWYLELPAEGVSEGVTRRTLALELRELELSGDPCRPGDTSESVHLHVSITRAEEAFVVQVWDRGDLAGKRTVSDKGHASTVGRRAALAAVELARQLAHRRAREARAMAREEELNKKIDDAERRDAAKRRVGLAARFDSLGLFEGAWALGPKLGVEVNTQLPLRFRTEVGWMAGALPVLASAETDGGLPGFSMVDLQAEGLWVFEPRDRTELELGLLLAVSALHTMGATEVDGIAGQRDTWTARIGSSVGGNLVISNQLRLRLNLSGGVMLRRVPLSLNGVDKRLGGAFIGAGLGVLLRP